MGELSRVIDGLIDSGVPLRRTELLAAAPGIAAEEAPLAPPSLITAAIDALAGLGPVERLMADPSVSDVLVNAPDEVWVERSGRLARTEVTFPDDAAIVAAAERAIAPLGLRLDRASPAVDARLADGSRLHAVIPPAAVDGPVLAVRRFTAAVPDLAALEASGAIDAAGATLLRTAIVDRRNIVVAGSTGSGKTTLLNVMSRAIPLSERIVTIEDAAELQLTGHVVRLEARPPNAEGAGEVAVRTLVRHALRLRPDRIVVGEVRGPEAFDVIQAMATGHDGSLSTVHAGSADEAVWRIETLALGAGELPGASLTRLLRSALDLIVVVERRADRRLVRSISQVGDTECEEVWCW